GFHADESVKFGQQGVTAAQNWLGTQRVDKIGDIAGLLQPVMDKVRDTVAVAMAYPAREERAYANGAQLYRDRAHAIKRKGAAKGYVSQPMAPQQPAPQPPSPSPTPPRHPEK